MEMRWKIKIIVIIACIVYIIFIKLLLMYCKFYNKRNKTNNKIDIITREELNKEIDKIINDDK